MTYTRTRLLPARSSGFTLVELLVVIGILAVLISLLFPVISSIRKAAYDADTKNEIGQISAACERYYDDFRAFPGPFSNTQLETQQSNIQSNPKDTYYTLPFFGSAWANPVSSSSNLRGAGNQMYLTGSQNLTLGLLGGLRWDSGSGLLTFYNGVNPTDPTKPTTYIGTGPTGLLTPGSSPGGNKQYTAYLSINYPGSNMMENGDGSFQTPPSPSTPNSDGGYHDYLGNMFGDAYIPVFTDKYPDPLPILYIRSRVGAKGVVSGYSTYASPTIGGLFQDPTTNTAAYYNYDIRQITPYTWSGATPNPAVAGIGISNGKGIIMSGSMPQHGLQGVGTLYYPITPPYSASAPPPTVPAAPDKPVFTNNVDNAGVYFLNASAQPSNITSAAQVNSTGTPRAKDTYILISAGRDRTYGTADDITSFGDVEP